MCLPHENSLSLTDAEVTTMLKRIYGRLLFPWTALFLLLSLLFPLPVKAKTSVNTVNASSAESGSDAGSYIWQNPDTGYRTILEDDAGLLSEEELAQLSEEMQGITAYGNAAFKTLSYNYQSTSRFAEDYYHELFGQQSGTLFLIDMGNREIYIFSDGSVYRTITSSYADTITDNVYRYASGQNYYLCASRAFEQMSTLLAGRKIAQPMKYISNALLALILASLINYFVIRALSRGQKPAASEILKASSTGFAFHNPQKHLASQKKVYSPPSSGGGSGGHSGGGGGGHSGGGGGHRF